LKDLRFYFFDPEDGGDMFLRNFGWNSTDSSIEKMLDA
jgi:hypothetical protein